MKITKQPTTLTAHSQSKLQNLYSDMFDGLPIRYESPACNYCGYLNLKLTKFTGWLAPASWAIDARVCTMCKKLLKINQNMWAQMGDRYIEKAFVLLQNQPAIIPEKERSPNAN